MRRDKRMILLVLMLMILGSVGVKAKDYDMRVEGNQVNIHQELGSWWQLELSSLSGQGFYLDYLEIGDYYQQFGAGLIYPLIDQPENQLSSFFGAEKYLLNQEENIFFRSGFRWDFPREKWQLSFGSHLFVDDELGIFVRSELELKLGLDWLKGNVGVGNLLGSKDGFAFWYGFDL